MEKVCVLIPSYNSEYDDLKKTILSIPKRMHIVIVDDGSYITVTNKIKDYCDGFDNIKVLRLDKNVGIEEALSYGVNSIIDDYEYIARLDVGDVSGPERFISQVEIMDKNNELVLIGTWAEFVNKNGEVLFIRKVPVDDNTIRKQMYLNNMFIHPSVLMRSSALKVVGGYRKKYIACEDYDLFFRLMKVGKVANIGLPLLVYEIDEKSISSQKRKIQVYNRLKIILANFTFFKHGVLPYYGVIRSVLLLLVNRNITMTIRKFIGK